MSFHLSEKYSLQTPFCLFLWLSVSFSSLVTVLFVYNINGLLKVLKIYIANSLDQPFEHICELLMSVHVYMSWRVQK
jgi:hypothetical protein